jgi:nucleoside-diphosphate-sugar epimerase
VADACKGISSIMHLAYLNGTEFFYSKPDLVLDIAVKGMVNILDGAILHNVPEFVLASSSETYQTPPVVPTPEDVPLVVPDVLNPRYSYGGGKIICELMAINYGRKHFQRTMIFRPHNVYGPDMGWEHVLPQFSLRMAAQVAAHPTGRVPFEIIGSGNETRSFIYIDDFTRGVTDILQHGKDQEIYHIGTEDEVTIRTVAELMASAYFGREIDLLPSDPAKGATPRRCPDTTKMRTEIGWAPRISLAQGLPLLTDWYVKNKDLKG